MSVLLFKFNFSGLVGKRVHCYGCGATERELAFENKMCGSQEYNMYYQHIFQVHFTYNHVTEG